MNSNTPTNPASGTLLDALGIAGGLRELARHLHVPQKQLSGWIEGDEPTPYSVFIRAIDFVRGAATRALAR